MPPKVRHLYLVLGDQLDHDSPLLAEADPTQDAFWMAEAAEEADHVWSHKLRIAFFFAAMRHYRDWLSEEGWCVHYSELPSDGRRDRGRGLGEILAADLQALKPERIVVVEPGDHRVRRLLEATCEEAGVPFAVRADSHFLLLREDFGEWAEGRRRFLLEDFYRMMRKRLGILMRDDGAPEGGEWNFDKDNRQAFGKEGPPRETAFGDYPPDETTQAVVALVRKRFADHPGKLDALRLPVTREDALRELKRFVAERLPLFGQYQDALWSGSDVLYHSRLSAVLNLKLLHPREVLEAALAAHQSGDAPLNAVEGFVRQVLGWREFVRGIYFLHGEAYLDRNALGAHEPLPRFFWDGQTEMACARDAMRNVLENGYAHHIQRLMVLGQFALLWGADPRQFHEWHMAMYLDAIDWVSAPNTIGMSQFADGGIVGTKPYCASGNYIRKMSNHCAQCAYRPSEATGERACPFTTLYWDFLARHHERFRGNRRMVFQVKNLERKDPGELKAIRARAAWLREELAS
ncbi:MAG: cryptochrome/photolyase family protein [Opitutales bacterium]